MPYQVVNLAKRVSDSCAAVYTEPFDIGVAEWRVLARLGQHQQLNSRHLGQVTFMDKSRVSRALKSLERKGLLLRQVDRGDNRASLLSLTAAGRRLYSQIVPRALDWESQFLSALDVTEYRDLLLILSKLESQLDAMETGACEPPA